MSIGRLALDLLGQNFSGPGKCRNGDTNFQYEIRDISQKESITNARRAVMDPSIDSETAMKLLADEYKSHIPYQRRLALFYLFNDVIQHAARSHKFEYLEHGSGVFLPVVTRHLERFSSKEKGPFLRTLSVWRDRHVYSAGFVEKLREQWEKPVQEANSAGVKTPVHVITPQASKRKLLDGDPKLFSIQEVTERLYLQGISTNRILSSITLLLPRKDERFIASSPLTSQRAPDFDLISGLKASLNAELKDILSCMMILEADSIEKDVEQPALET